MAHADRTLQPVAASTTSSLTEDLAAFTASLEWQDIPDPVAEKAKCHVLDTLGVAVAGSALPSLQAIAESFADLDGRSDCTVIGTRLKWSPQNAAFLNGMMAHAFDYDDTHLETILHPSGVLVPTALAVGERVGADGRAFLTALIAGYEVSMRLVQAVRPRQFFERGIQATTLIGVFGAAVTAGKLIGLSEAQLADAMGLAASQAGGIRQFSAAGEASDSKRFHTGWPALAGIMAAHLAGKGLTAPRRVLEGQRSLYLTHLGEPAANEMAIVSDLGKRWETLNLAPKLYSCCATNQPYLDIARNMRRNGILPEIIKSVELKVEPKSARVCQPLDEKRHPRSPYTALLALPFGVALMFVRGHAVPNDFNESALKDAEIHKMAERITFSIEATDSEYVADRSAWIVVETVDGRKIEERVSHNRGGPENPLSVEEYREKFDIVTKEILDTPQNNSVAETVLGLEHSTTRELAASLALDSAR